MNNVPRTYSALDPHRLLQEQVVEDAHAAPVVGEQDRRGGLDRLDLAAGPRAARRAGRPRTRSSFGRGIERDAGLLTSATIAEAEVDALPARRGATSPADWAAAVLKPAVEADA